LSAALRRLRFIESSVTRPPLRVADSQRHGFSRLSERSISLFSRDFSARAASQYLWNKLDALIESNVPLLELRPTGARTPEISESKDLYSTIDLHRYGSDANIFSRYGKFDVAFTFFFTDRRNGQSAAKMPDKFTIRRRASMIQKIGLFTGGFSGFGTFFSGSTYHQPASFSLPTDCTTGTMGPRLHLCRRELTGPLHTSRFAGFIRKNSNSFRIPSIGPKKASSFLGKTNSPQKKKQLAPPHLRI